MGVQMNSQNEDNTEYVNAVKEICILIHKRSFDFIQRYNILFQFTPTAQKQKRLLKILHGFSEKVIVDRRKKLIEENNNNVVNVNDIGEKKKMALLDILLQSNVNGNPLTNEEIRQEVDTFMFEGHDTTTSGLAFGLYNIARHPHVQKKIMEEIRQVIGDNPDEIVTMSQLNDLNYLELVIKESLRLYPSVPLFGRKALEEFDLNGKTIPAGTNIIIGAYFMGRNPELFHDPEQFIPERYNVEKSADKSNPYAYVPFSAGQRNCIGQKFALLELKSTLSKVLRHYEISIPPNYEPIPVLELIVKSENGVLLQIKDRVYE